MKIYLLVFLIAGALAVPNTTQSQQNRQPIDDDALLTFTLMMMQNQGQNLTDQLIYLIPILFETGKLDYERQLFLLAAGGLSRNTSEHILNDLMPLLMAEGKSTQETVVTLLFISKQFCRNESGAARECVIDVDTLMPLIRMKFERGCDGKEMLFSEKYIVIGEMCRCDEQTNAFFWANLIEQFRHKNTSIPDRFPVAMMALLDGNSCKGHLKFAESACSCSTVTKGNVPVWLQYFFTSDNVRKRLSEEQRRAMRETFAAPQQRILGIPNGNINLQDFLFSQLAGTLDPVTLSLIQNRGSNVDALLRQIILASIGLDSSLLQVILNGGFNDGPEKVALISYLTNLGIIDSSILPLILGVNSGRQFYIRSLLESGSIDPTVGLLLLAQQSGLPQADTLQLLIEAASGSRNNPDYFSSLGRPYIPPLPEGIFPGSKLFFAHFETLEVNTCSLHDLRNRFECGYIGISAAECEVVPYCCYNPIFLTDVEVRAATEGSITAASAIPWCYYNVFFVYFDTFSLDVKKPGGFASPIECRPLFNYGLSIDPNLFILLNSSSSSTISNLIIQRRECGFPGITEFHCVAIRGCCFDPDAPFRVPQCFFSNRQGNFDYTFDDLPAAYRPPNGSCNVNRYQIPVLYYLRVACHYSIKFHKFGYNVLSIPNRFDCLTKLGCCYEDDDSVIERYPFTPRCYRTMGDVSIPGVFPMGGVEALFRSGDAFRNLGFPPVEKPKGK